MAMDLAGGCGIIADAQNDLVESVKIGIRPTICIVTRDDHARMTRPSMTIKTQSLKVGILGAAGYTGVELLRLLAGHPHAALHCITSREFAGRAVGEVFASLRAMDLKFIAPDEIANKKAGEKTLAQCDVVFCAAPNGVAMTHAVALLDAGVKVIDLSADFRLRDVKVWEKWYGIAHACPQLLDEAVYGLPEVNRARIKSARLVANPGCYPTAVQLGFLPLLENANNESGEYVDLTSLIADAKSGVSGAGRGAVHTAFGEVGESFTAYAASGHRHLPEMQQQLSQAAGRAVDLVFTPHLLPIVRGIHATLYARLKSDIDLAALQALYQSRYAAEPFVDVLPGGAHPDTRSVRGANVCRIAVHRPHRDCVVVLAVIDNLVKGAAGQAIQNMNLMFDLPETAALDAPALLP